MNQKRWSPASELNFGEEEWVRVIMFLGLERGGRGRGGRGLSVTSLLRTQPPASLDLLHAPFVFRWGRCKLLIEYLFFFFFALAFSFFLFGIKNDK